MTTPELLHCHEQCFVNGQWIGIPNLAITNPANGEVIGHVPNLNAADVEMAIIAAQDALEGWAGKSAKARSRVLRAWFDLVVANREGLARLLTTEQGKPLSEALGEIDYAASYIEYYAEEAKRLNGEILPAHITNARVMVQRQPIGVVAAITPWNFPAAMLTRKLAPALAAGCTALLKPAPETPLTALALAALAHEAGVPAGALNVVTGEASVIGKAIMDSPVVRMVTFTGSTTVGKLLMAQASATMKRVALELGGNAPFLAFDDADLDAAVEGAIYAKFRNMGQTCVSVNRLYVQDGIYDEFARRLADRVATLKIGNGLEADTTQGPLINSAALAKVERLVSDAVAKGAEIVTGGHRSDALELGYAPTVLTGITSDMAISAEETFGPVLPIARFTEENEAVRAANDSPYGLAAYLYTRDIARIFRVSRALEYGMVGINSTAISSEIVPFGGIKESGVGREGSRHGIEEYTDLKYMLLGGLG